jgi:hypothetical protein
MQDTQQAQYIEKVLKERIKLKQWSSVCSPDRARDEMAADEAICSSY